LIYDALVNSVLKELQAAFVGGLILVVGRAAAVRPCRRFGVRGYAIHLGTMFGTIMASTSGSGFGPRSRKSSRRSRAVRTRPALVALAGTRSRHNTYMWSRWCPDAEPALARLGEQPAGPDPCGARRLGTRLHLYSRAAAVKGSEARRTARNTARQQEGGARPRGALPFFSVTRPPYGEHAARPTACQPGRRIRASPHRSCRA